MRLITLIGALIGPVALLATASANAADTERYRLEKTEQGYVRMDTQTGEMSICEERAGQLVCKLATDARTAFEDELARLQDTVAKLEARIGKLETRVPAGSPSALPSEEEFEKTLGYMERFLRRFLGVAKEMDDSGKSPDQQTAPAPDKT